jgi:GTP-binding protein
MITLTATFISSSPSLRQCPEEELPEFAFIGRSNVGKSSLINMLTGRKGLAKVSGSPGKTRMINHFLINGRWYLVDLPGYGFAKISKQERIRHRHLIEDYLLNRKTLKRVFLLIDSRHEPQKIDLEFMSGLLRYDIPFTILFTKTDKLTRNEIRRNSASYISVLKKSSIPVPPLTITSSVSRTGREEILEEILRLAAPVTR